MKSIVLSLALFFLDACVTHSSPPFSPGIQEGYRSYIPARTAVMSCRSWPATSNFAGHPLSNSPEEDRQGFCKRFDEHVLDSFKGQNFMRGLSPRAVEKSLTDANKKTLVESLSKHWRLDVKACANCSDLGTFYERVVKPRRDWREWLIDFSTHTHHSDAVLIPFVDFAKEDRENDRGLLLSKRSIGLTLMLIDTQSADLIWIAKRDSTLSKHRLTDYGEELKFPEFPEWSLVLNELLIDTLWKEYPGRIFL